jgi:hypothetical protein
MSVIWKNTGQLPAKRVIAWLNGDAFDLGKSPEDIGFADVTSFNSLTKAMGPGQQIASQIEAPLSDLIDVWEKKRRYFLWGWIEYDDGFQGTPRRRTEICFEVFIGSDPRGIEAWQFFRNGFATKFNAFDDDCVEKPKTAVSPRGEI